MKKSRTSICLLGMALSIIIYVLSIACQYLGQYYVNAASAIAVVCTVFMSLSGVIQLLCTVFITDKNKEFIKSLVFAAAELAAGLVLTAGIIDSGSLIYVILQFVSTLSGIFVYYFYCTGIMELLSSEGKTGLNETGNNCLKTFTLLALSVLVMYAFSLFVNGLGALATIAMLVAIAYVALSIASYTRFFLFLLKAIKVLS